jgi:hypothetical protein
VAVVQISRIQVRRGKKGTSNIPQLASGEIGWAVDSQELYIGNGSVSEGAPQVGNTKILTAADSIFEISSSYEYKSGVSYIQTGATAKVPTTSSLQKRLDYDVYVANFGAEHDTSVIQTPALQRAIDNIFLNTKSSPENRYVLHLAPGMYKIDNSLKIPPYTTLKGAGKDKTIIEQTTNNPIFVTINGSSTVGNYDTTTALTAANQATNIEISDMTLQYHNAATNIYNTAIDLQSSLYGRFSNLKIKAHWDGDGVQANSIAINLKSFSASIRSKDNLFENCDIEGFCYGVNSSYDIEDNSFRDFTFKTLLIGVRLGNGMPAVDYTDATDLADKLGQGEAYGPNNTLIENSTFKEIFAQAFVVDKGFRNTSLNNKYYDVGNDGGTSANVTTSVIKFVTAGNHTLNDYFQRTEDLSYGSDYVTVSDTGGNNWDSDTVEYLPEVEGIATFANTTVHSVTPVNTAGNWATAFRLPADRSKSYELQYHYNSDNVNGARHGTLNVLLDKENNNISVTDDFEFIGNDNSVSGDGNNLTFRGKFVNVVNSTTGAGPTVYIEMKNATSESTVILPTLTFTITSRT